MSRVPLRIAVSPSEAGMKYDYFVRFGSKKVDAEGHTTELPPRTRSSCAVHSLDFQGLCLLVVIPICAVCKELTCCLQRARVALYSWPFCRQVKFVEAEGHVGGCSDRYLMSRFRNDAGFPCIAGASWMGLEAGAATVKPVLDCRLRHPLQLLLPNSKHAASSKQQTTDMFIANFEHLVPSIFQPYDIDGNFTPSLDAGL